MRFVGLGLIWVLVCSCACFARVGGTVDVIGFEDTARPDCWTPMVVSLTSTTEKTDFYQLRVKVDDMDRDSAVYTRTISVTGGGGEGNGGGPQKFRMYFIPPPTDDGLPDKSSANALKDLQDRVHVGLYTPAGKWVADLPITSSVENLDPKGEAWVANRGRRLVLTISDGHSAPIYSDSNSLDGVSEDVAWVQTHAGNLPEKALGYQAVDTIVWLDADPAALRAGGDEKFRALHEWVRTGGRLVICQPFDWQKILAMDDLLPVTDISIEEKADLNELRQLAVPRDSMQRDYLRLDPFAGAKPPYRFARATAKPGTITDAKITWASPTDQSPYIVRMPLGAGSVTWIAQDLGDPSLAKGRAGWATVWDKVFDWHDSPIPQLKEMPEELSHPWKDGSTVDIGRIMLSGMDLGAKGLTLITLAILFFIIYWLATGPGTYIFLAAKNKTQSSWFVFAAGALIATGITLLLVKAVLRGPPELRHFSLIRTTPDGPAQVISRFGLYIPRDGNQRITLDTTAPQTETCLSPLPLHPEQLKKSPAQTGPEYLVPIVDQVAGQAAQIVVPYRSTLKKFQAEWSGDVGGAIQGSARLVPNSFIDGKLTNGTTHVLYAVYFAFKYQSGAAGIDGNWMLYLPRWEAGQTIDLAKSFNRDGDTPVRLIYTDSPLDDKRPARGRLETDWAEYWYDQHDLHGSGINDSYDDSGAAIPKSLPMMSFFECLPPCRNDRDLHKQISRVNLYRRGGRYLDVSSALSAGSLVVLGTTNEPLPLPLSVDGVKVSGEGTAFYQAILPLDHSALATTQPTE